MKAIIIGFGEVGKAHFELLSKVYPDIYYKDKDATIFDSAGEELAPDNIPDIDVMLVATQCDAKNIDPFVKMVREYHDKFLPHYINILTTTPPGTCEKIQEDLPAKVSHSTTRGLHPHLARAFYHIPKHIGGAGSEEMGKFFSNAGWKVYTHKQSRTTEVAHILNNIAYGINIKLADELNHLCRQFGVDYMESVVAYTQSNNEGYAAIDHKSKCRMVLTPPYGSIGGHCVVYSANCVPQEYLAKAPMVEGLAKTAQGQRNY